MTDNQTSSQGIPAPIVEHFSRLIEQGYNIGVYGAEASGVIEVTESGKLVIADQSDRVWQNIEVFLRNEFNAEDNLVRLAELVEQVTIQRVAGRQGNASSQSMMESLQHHIGLSRASNGATSTPSHGPDEPRH